MNKREFLSQLRKGLSGLPSKDIEERVIFYSEMIDDRMEEGLLESEAVAEIGPIDAVIAQILSDTPLTKLVKEKVKPSRGLKAWEIVLLALGSPIWLSLLIAAFAVAFAAYVVIWSAVITLWSVEAALMACSLGGVVSGAVFAIFGNAVTGLAMLGAGVFCAGLSVFLFFGCKGVTKGLLLLTKKMAFGIKALFVGKETAQ